MGETTKISWCDKTFNPIIGCSKVHSGCANCYAEDQMDKRYQKAKWGPSGTRVLTSEANWRKPVKWNKEAEGASERPRVFCASLSDVFEDWGGEIRDSNGEIIHQCSAGHWTSCSSVYAYGVECDHACGKIAKPVTMHDIRRRLFAIIDATPNLDWLLLTKRPENIRKMWQFQRIDGAPAPLHNWPRKNVWLGTSISEQAHANHQVPELLKCRDLTPVLFVSAEPLLGPINFGTIPARTRELPQGPRSIMANDWEVLYMNPLTGFRATSFFSSVENEPKLDWVIAGGESGPNRREMPIEAIESLAKQCERAGVPFHCKQDSNLYAGQRGRLSDELWNLKQFPKGQQ